MKFFSRRMKTSAFLFSSLTFATLSGTTLANAQTTEGYKAGGTSSAGIFLEEADSLGKRQVSLAVRATDVVDCGATFSNEGFWARICEKVTKDGGGPQNFVGTLQPVKGNLVLEGIVARPNGDFEFMLGVLLRDDGSVLAVNTMRRDLSELSSVFFDGSRSDIEKTSAGSAPIIAELNGSGIEASIELSEVKYDGERDATLNITYKNGQCVPPLKETDGWLRICEIAMKDGPYSISGTLKPLANDRGAFAGLLSPGDGRRSFQVVVSQARDGYALVGLREKKEPVFRSANVLENIIFSGNVQSPQSGTIDLSANDWRVETESISTLGANIELTFQKLTDDSYTGNLSFWFPQDANAYCPSTSALLKICESADKDGPLPLTLGIDRIEQNIKFGFTGIATVPPGYGPKWGPFNFDLRQGSSIGDWGDEEADALYIRFTTNDVAPGAEPVGWLKIVPLDRSMQKIDGDRKLASLQSDPENPNKKSAITIDNRLSPQEDTACNKDLYHAYYRAKNMDGSHVRMTKDEWDTMIDRIFNTTLEDINRFTGDESVDLVVLCQNAEANFEALINNTRATERSISRNDNGNGNGGVAQKPVQCREMDAAIAALRAANGLRSNGTPIENWEAQLQFITQFLRALPPDPQGTGKSCEKGLEVIVALLMQLGIDHASVQPVAPPAPNPLSPNQDQPNGGTFCETLARTYAQIGSIAEQNRAREVLLRDNRFGTWKLPSSELSCQVAGELFAENRIRGF